MGLINHIEREYEIYDSLGQRWTCSIFKNGQYRDSPSFMRIRCQITNFDKILDSLNDQHTLLKILHFITFYNRSATNEEKNKYHIKSDYVMNINLSDGNLSST